MIGFVTPPDVIKVAYSNRSLAMSTPTTPNATVTPSTQPEADQDAEALDQAALPHDGDHNQGGRVRPDLSISANSALNRTPERPFPVQHGSPGSRLSASRGRLRLAGTR
jgi:hypothetical protein